MISQHPHKYSDCAKMCEMVKMTKYKICTYLDHMSDYKKFDTLYGGAGENKKVLPYFWQFVMEVFNEPYRQRQVTPKLMEEFTMNKSRCIRPVYRWTQRRNGDDK